MHLTILLKPLQTETLKNKHKIIILISGLCFLIILISAGVLFNKFYLSKVILSGPFSVTINNVPDTVLQIKIFGYSPFGRIQLLENDYKEKKIWHYDGRYDYSSLLIYSDTDFYANNITISAKNTEYKISGIKLPKNSAIELKSFIQHGVPLSVVLTNMLFGDEVQFIFIFLLVLFLFCLISFLVFKYLCKIKTTYKIFWFLFVPVFLLHVFFHIYSGFFLITSGLIMVIFITLIFLLIITTIGLLINKRLGNFKIITISIAAIFFLFEFLFLIIGFKSTAHEKRHKLYYSSQYTQFRNKNKQMYHIWTANHALKNKEYEYKRIINSERLSDKEHPVRKPENGYRIIGLGDSFTEGDGADADSTWLKFLERDLSKYTISKQLTYINGGVCGSDLLYSYVLLKNKLLKYKPDLVLLAINSSDLTDIFIRGGMERFQSDGSVRFRDPPWWEPIYALSRISRLFFSALGYNELLYKEKKTDFKKEKQIIIENIHAYHKLAIENNFKFVVIFNPHKGEIEAGQMSLSGICEQLKHSKEVEVLNLLDYFIKKEKINSSNCGQYYWKKDGHHNAKGYELFARGVEWKLKEIGIIDSLMKKK